MTIKRTKVTKMSAPSAGGAAIADRFRLDAPAPDAANMVGKKAATYALVAGVTAFLVAGVLVFILYKHWEFLMPA